MLSLAAAALALYDSSKPKEGDVYYATVKNFHSVVLSQPGAVAVQFFDYSCSHCKALRPAWRSACNARPPGASILAPPNAGGVNGDGRSDALMLGARIPAMFTRSGAKGLANFL